MNFDTVKQTISDSIRKVSASKTPGRIASSLQISGNLSATQAYIGGFASDKLPAFDNTVANTSLASTISLGTLSQKTMYTVDIEFINASGNILYTYKGLVPSGYVLTVTPVVDETLYNVSNSTFSQTVTSNVATTITIPNK